MVKRKTIASLEAELKFQREEYENLKRGFIRRGNELNEQYEEIKHLKLVIQRNDGRIDALLTTIVMFQNRDLAFQDQFAKTFGIENMALAVPLDKIQTDQVMEREFQFNSGTWDRKS